jgi:hypothetical protein
MVESGRRRRYERVPSWERKRQRAKARAAVSVGRDNQRAGWQWIAEEVLSLRTRLVVINARQLTLGVREKLQTKRSIWHTVQSSGNGNEAIVK